MKKFLRILGFLCFCSFYSFAQNGAELFSNDTIHEIRITFEEPNFWEILNQNYQQNFGNPSGSTIEYLMGNVEIDGNQLDSIGIRQKGFSSYFFVDGPKKSLKLDFNEFVPGQRYEGLRKINLNNGVGDPALQRDFLCFDMIREAGGVAPRVAYAKVYLNDEYWGLYVMIEQVDKEFLDANFQDEDSNHDCNSQFAAIGWHDLVINEFMASNSEDGGIADPAGSYADWIEIYNNSEETVDLGTLYLSDKADSLFK